MRKFIRRIIGYFGYDIVKTMPTPRQNKVRVTVGKFQIHLPKFNPLIKTYFEHPDFASEISRLTVAMIKKYPDLTFLDIGANVGDTVARVKSAADIPVISVEGDDISYE